MFWETLDKGKKFIITNKKVGDLNFEKFHHFPQLASCEMRLRIRIV